MATWTYTIDDAAVVVTGEQVRVVAALHLDGKPWAGREVVLPLETVKAAAPEQLKALLDEHLGGIIKREGEVETAVKKQFEAFAVASEVPVGQVK